MQEQGAGMSWIVEFHDDFEAEFESMDEDVQDALLAAAKAVQLAGSRAGRPYVDTLGGSKHANMKELRFDAKDGREVWRAALAFDPERRAIVLTAGAKQGISQRLFYKRLIKKADARFDSHLKAIADGKKRRKD
jgi:hypothetical protein